MNDFNNSMIKALLHECRSRIDQITGNGNSYDNFVSLIRRSIAASLFADGVKLIEAEKKIEEESGSELRLLYIQSLIYQLFLEKFEDIDRYGFPSEISKYLKEDFGRILDIAKSGDKIFLTFSNFQCRIYVEKLCLKCYPAGNQNVVVSGIPRSLVLQQNASNAIKLIRLLADMGGNSPLFEFHYNPHRFRWFNLAGWEEVFKLTAQMMIIKKNIKGVFGTSWFYDPAIKEVSPEIYYIRELIEKIGGKFYFFGSTEQDRKNAFAMSIKRKTAYEEGRYNPASYMMIIQREVLLHYYNA